MQGTAFQSSLSDSAALQPPEEQVEPQRARRGQETVEIQGVDGLTVTGRYEPEEPEDRRVHGYSLGHPGSPARFIATSAALHGYDLTPLLTNADGIDYIEVMTWLEEQALKDR